MEKDIKLKYKFSRKSNKAQSIHCDLIKMEVSYKLKRIYCLMNHTIWVLNFDSPILIESQIPCIYVADFSISDDLMVIGSGDRSGNQVLKMVFLEKHCRYNSLGEPKNGKLVWAAKSRLKRRNIHGMTAIDDFDERAFPYVKFLPSDNQFIAFGYNTLYKINDKGKILAKLNIEDVYFPYRYSYSRSKIIDINDENIFVAAYKTIRIIDIKTFVQIEQIEFQRQIHIVTAMNNKDAIVILDDGTIYLLENGLKKEFVKINREIVAFEFDRINSICYFGNSSGEVFAVNKNADLIMDEHLGDSIRDILVLNNGEHILFAGKEINFFLFENKKSVQTIGNTDKLNFRNRKGTGMKKVFISYSHKDSDLADFIDDKLLNNGIQLTRDVRDIRYRQSIKEFMKSIRNTDYVFIIISNDYLTSSACMYEILELIKDENYYKRIIPIVRDSAKIFNVNDRAKYIEYWQNEFSETEEHSKKIDILNRSFYIDMLRQIESIQRNLPDFLERISDMKLIVCKNPMVTDDEIKMIIDIINS